MKKWTYIISVALLAMVIVLPVNAQMKKVAQTGLQFLKIDMSPRTAAMGGAYLLIGDDATAMFSNPAGISSFEGKVDVFASRTTWIADITYNAFGAIVNLDNWGSFGISAVMPDYGTIEGTIVADNEQGYESTGNLDVGAYAVGLSYGRRLSSQFSIGGQVKYVGQNLGSSVLNDGSEVENKVDGLAFDFGTIYYPGFKSFRFGMSIRNFSEEFKYEKEGFQLPLTFTIGIAMDVMDLISEDHSDKLLVAIDALHPRDYSERLHFGAEYQLMSMFAFRAGYKYNYDIESFSVGMGFMKEFGGIGVKIDYAYSDIDYFDAINRFSLGISF